MSRSSHQRARRRRIADQRRAREAWHAELAAMLKTERALAALADALGEDAARARWAVSDPPPNAGTT